MFTAFSHDSRLTFILALQQEELQFVGNTPVWPQAIYDGIWYISQADTHDTLMNAWLPQTGGVVPPSSCKNTDTHTILETFTSGNITTNITRVCLHEICGHCDVGFDDWSRQTKLSRVSGTQRTQQSSAEQNEGTRECRRRRMTFSFSWVFTGS